MHTGSALRFMLAFQLNGCCRLPGALQEPLHRQALLAGQWGHLQSTLHQPAAARQLVGQEKPPRRQCWRTGTRGWVPSWLSWPAFRTCLQRCASAVVAPLQQCAWQTEAVPVQVASISRLITAAVEVSQKLAALDARVQP